MENPKYFFNRKYQSIFGESLLAAKFASDRYVCPVCFVKAEPPVIPYPNCIIQPPVHRICSPVGERPGIVIYPFQLRAVFG